MAPLLVTFVREQRKDMVTVVTMSSEKSPDPTDTSLPLHERVQAARIKAGFLQVRPFARSIGISHVALLKIESSKTNLLHHKTLGTLLKLAKKLKTDFGEPWLTPFVHLADLTPEEEGILRAAREYSPHEQKELWRLLDAIKALPPEERIKRFEEWRTQGKLQDNPGQLASNVVNLNSAQKNEPPTAEPRVLPPVTYRGGHGNKRLQPNPDKSTPEQPAKRKRKEQ